MISVVIPVFNTELYLERCIQSVLHSRYKDFEVILVNDGSTDSSPQICRRYCRKDSRIRFIDQYNRGVSVARNRGIEESRGEWIVFVDSDDQVSEDFLESIANAEYQDQDMLIFNYGKYGSSISGVPGKHIRKRAEKKDITEIPYGKADAPELIEKILRAQQLECNGKANLRTCWAKAYKKEVLDRYKIRFPEGIPMGEDRLFNIEYQRRARSRLYISRTVYFVQWRTESASHCYRPDLLERDYRFQKRQKQLLERYGLLPELAGAYYDSVLSNMAHVLIKGIFSPHSPMRYREKCHICQKMQKGVLYRQALEYVSRSGSKTGVLPRRILFWFYRRQCYGIVNLICRLSYEFLQRI